MNSHHPGWTSAALPGAQPSADEGKKAKANAQRWLNVISICLHYVLIMMIFNSLTDFMDLVSTLPIWTATVGIITLSALMERYRKWLFAGFAVSIFSSGLFIILGLRHWPHLIRQVWTFLTRWIEFLYGGYHGTLTSVPADLGYFTAWLILLPVSLWGFSAIRQNTAWPTLMSGIGILTFQWVFHFDPAQSYLQGYLALGIPFMAIIQTSKWIKDTLPRALTRFRLGHILGWIAALTIMTLLVSAALPIQPATWRLTTIRQWMSETFPVLEELRGHSADDEGRPARIFSLKVSGFGASDSLGGPLELDESPALHIVIDPSAVSTDEIPFPLHMRGRTLVEYTGQGWIADEQEEWEWYDSGELLPANLPENIATRRISTEITFKNLETSSIFAAGDVRRTHLPDQLVEQEDTDSTVAKNLRGDVLSHRPLVSEQTYQNAVDIPFWEIEEDDTSSSSNSEYSEDLDIYLQLPQKIPSRVKALAVDLIADADNNFAKAEAIAAHLRQLPYSTDVSPVPQDREFTDFFLFEEQKGYCTYFSTAMAVMLRAVGVPTRWVKGFVISSDILEPVSGESQDDYLEGTVPLSSAHAWVEVWTGQHWIPFDPTPRFTSIDHTRQAPSLRIDTPDEERTDDIESPSEERDQLIDEELGDEPLTRRPEQHLLIRIMTQIVLLGIPLLVIALLIMYFSERIREHHLAKKALRNISDRYNMATAEVVIATTLAHQMIAEHLELDPQGLTIREFALEVEQHSKDLGTSMHRLVNLYEPVVYGGHHASESNGLEAELQLETTLLLLKQNLGTAQYLKQRFNPTGVFQRIQSTIEKHLMKFLDL